VRKIISELKDKGLDMGHGEGWREGRKYSLKDVDELRELTEKALLLIDLKLGIEADFGRY